MIEINAYVFHQKYGIGQIKQIESKSIDVYFTIGIKKFPYPNSIGKDLYEIYDKSYVLKNNKLIRYIGKEVDITIPQAITIIGYKAFDSTNIESISFDNHVEKIEDKAFYKCKNLLAVTDTDNLEIIGSKAFLGCVSLAHIKLPDSLWDLEGGVFSKCFSLTQMVIPKNIKNVDYELFLDCHSLENVFFEGNVKTIENDAFRNCDNLNQIFLSESLTKIGKGSFINCPRLNMIYIPKSVKSIHPDAFDESIIIKCENRSYTERYSKKNGIQCLLTNNTNKTNKRRSFELPIFARRHKNLDDNQTNIMINQDTDLSQNENEDSAEEIITKALLSKKKKRSGSLSNMTTIEKLVYSGLAIAALLYSKDNLTNMYEQAAFGHITTSEGVYTGEAVLGSISGEGTMEFNDGRIYSGKWENGLPNGSGKLTLANGSTFVGEFSKGVFDDGEYLAKDKQNNQIHFNIIDSEPVSYSYIYKDGTTIEKDLVSSGSDYHINFSNGDSYVGKLFNNIRDGKGDYYWSDKSKFEGFWSNDSMSRGTLTYPTGTTLTGDFLNNTLYDGAITFARDNYAFSIKIEEGKDVGEYAILNSRSEIYRGSIYSNQVKGSGTVVFNNKDKYVGEIVGGKKQGYGEYTWSDGSRYVGNWKDDKMNGYGIYYYGDVQRIEGTFIDGKPNGTCYYYDEYGTAYTAYWNNGQQTSIYKR